jgi:hypothetical protein
MEFYSWRVSRNFELSRRLPVARFRLLTFNLRPLPPCGFGHLRSRFRGLWSRRLGRFVPILREARPEIPVCTWRTCHGLSWSSAITKVTGRQTAPARRRCVKILGRQGEGGKGDRVGEGLRCAIERKLARLRPRGRAILIYAWPVLPPVELLPSARHPGAIRPPMCRTTSCDTLDKALQSGGSPNGCEQHDSKRRLSTSS